MPAYTLTYFPLRARGEVARYLLFLSGQEWVDNRIEFKDWAVKKKEQPFGALPVLEGDGLELCQSVAICGYLGRKYGYAGSSPQDASKCDMIGSCCEDMIAPYIRFRFQSKTEEDKQEGYKKFREEMLPDYIGKFEKFLKLNKGGDGWIVGDSLTWADISVYHWVNWFKSPDVLGVDVDALLQQFPKIAAHFKRVEAHPKVAEYIKVHPQTGR